MLQHKNSLCTASHGPCNDTTSVQSSCQSSRMLPYRCCKGVSVTQTRAKSQLVCASTLLVAHTRHTSGTHNTIQFCCKLQHQTKKNNTANTDLHFGKPAVLRPCCLQVNNPEVSQPIAQLRCSSRMLGSVAAISLVAGKGRGWMAILQRPT